MSNLGNTPQFGTAEYAGVAGTEHCQFCRQPISRRYYRVNSAMACAACGERAQHELPKDSHALFVRGLIFGIGAAVLGLILYATVEIATGLIIGYVSLAVGYLVGKGIKMGSRGAGGDKYQITAALLTYAAVSLSAVPVWLWHSQGTLGPADLPELAIKGLASPFLRLTDSYHGIIGLVILFIGIQIAWRLTAGTEIQVLGPFETAPSPS